MGTDRDNIKLVTVSRAELRNFAMSCVLLGLWLGWLCVAINAVCAMFSALHVTLLLVFVILVVGYILSLKQSYDRFIRVGGTMYRITVLDEGPDSETEDHKPVVEMEWHKVYLFDSETVPGIECSNCGFEDIYDFEISPLPGRCPKCGAVATNEERHAEI